MNLSTDSLIRFLRFSFSRSSGPGGQNVNKLNTRVSASLDIPACDAFTDDQKQRLQKVLASRLDSSGTLTVTSQKHRSQHANRLDAIDRLTQLIHAALKPPRVRKKTKVPRSATEKRLKTKKQHSQIKQLRSKQID